MGSALVRAAGDERGGSHGGDLARRKHLWLQPGSGALCSKVLLSNWVDEQRKKKRKAEEEPLVITGEAAITAGSPKVLRTEA